MNVWKIFQYQMENVIVFIENQGCMNTEGLYKTLQNEFKLVLT